MVPVGAQFSVQSHCCHTASGDLRCSKLGNLARRPTMSQTVSYLWREPKAAEGFKAGVSLHSPTNQSKELIGDLPDVVDALHDFRPAELDALFVVGLVGDVEDLSVVGVH